MNSIIEPLYPAQDPTRKDRIVQDVIDLMKLRDDDLMKAKIRRWLSFTLTKAQRFNRLSWWFAKRLFACKVYEGQDVFDLQGQLDRLIAVFCPGKLRAKSMDTIIQRRAEADYYHQANSGIPEYYAIHGGRLHLWPAPDSEFMFTLTYSIPLIPDIVPPEWETYLVDGIIGLYGRHFDSSGLLEDAAGFEAAFWEGIKSTRANHFDSEPVSRVDYADPRTIADTLFGAYTEVNSTDYSNAIIKPAYLAPAGQVQILADKGQEASNTRGTPMMQIGGDKQP